MLKKDNAFRVRIVLTFDERRRVAMFVSLLIAIDRRVNGRKKQTKKPRPVKEARARRGPSSLSITILCLWNHNQYITNMIDTIVITLTQDMYHLSESASAHLVLQNNGILSKQNPTKKELKHGIYKPRLTLLRRINKYVIHETILKIELSLPKLFFGNNFEELRYKDFLPVVQKLATMLDSMGIIVSADTLAQASVSAIHYSKNIILIDGSTPYHYINKIKEANIKLSLDVNQTDYRNDGHSYKWHCNAYEVAFYDKIKDLEIAKKSSKRAFEKDNTLQLHILNRIQRHKKWEVLRMEVRLNKRQKMKALFHRLSIKADLTLRSYLSLP